MCSAVVRPIVALVSVAVVLAASMAPAAAAGSTTISGVVTDAGGLPLEGIVVTVSSTQHSTQASTGPDGAYTTGPVPDGSYTVSFAQVDGPDPRRPVQYWPKVWSATQASQVVTSDATAGGVTGIDAVLELPATVSGTVRDTEGAALPGSCVTAWALAGDTQHYIGDTAVELDGTYRFNSLPPARVQLQSRDCSSPLEYLTTWLEPIDLVAGTSQSGVDAVLERGGSIVGTVRDEAGEPLADVCVTASSQLDSVSSQTASTAADGTYQMTLLAPGRYDVELRPCDDRPYLSTTLPGVVVAAGVVVAGVDAQLRRATTISGTVLDPTGAPVEEVCVQASDGTSVRGSDRTAEDGTYRVDVDGGGQLSLQYVDCRESPALAGVRTELVLVEREDRSGADVTMPAGAPASLGGTITNVRGEPIVGVCVVAYLPFETVLFGRSDVNGAYRIPAVGSGTWALAFLNCPEPDGPDEDPTVLDPVTGLRWAPQWLGGATLSFTESAEPDPVAAGADMVTLAPGQDAVADHCFGCGALRASIVLDGVTVRADVDVASLAVADLSAADERQYSLSCVAASTDVVGAATAEVVSSSTALVLDGLEPDRAHRCRVRMTIGGVLVADSDEQVLGSDVVALTPEGDSSAGRAAAARPLSFVG